MSFLSSASGVDLDTWTCPTCGGTLRERDCRATGPTDNDPSSLPLMRRIRRAMRSSAAQPHGQSQKGAAEKEDAGRLAVPRAVVRQNEKSPPALR